MYISRTVMKSAKNTITIFASSALALGCWVYTLFRAMRLAITHDEALSYLIFSYRPLEELLKPEIIGMSANNHLLNTLLTHCCVDQFGATEIAMRIPTLCGAACYFLACVLIAHGLFRGVAAVCACVLLLANPYVLDFMPLARGYSLALGLSMLGVWLLLQRIKRNENNVRPGLTLSFLSALLFGLAPFANLAYLNLFLAACCCLLGIEYLYGIRTIPMGMPGRRSAISKHLLRTVALFVPSAAALLLVYWRPVALLRHNKQFFFGGEQGFVRDTMTSLLHNWLYAPWFDSVNLVPVAWIALPLLGLAGPVSLVLAWRRKRIEAYCSSLLPWSWLLLVIPALESQTQHLLLGTRFLLDRTALFFIPVALLLLLGGLQALGETDIFTSSARIRRTGKMLLACCAGIALCHTLLVSTPEATREWRYNACATRQLEKLADIAFKALRSGQLQPPVLVGTDYLLEPSTLFFINKYQLGWMEWRTADTPEEHFPLYLGFTKNAQAFLQAGYTEYGACDLAGSTIFLRTDLSGR